MIKLKYLYFIILFFVFLSVKAETSYFEKGKNLFDEKKYSLKSARVMIGVDEVGRGCWAGPVLSCASYIYPSKFTNLPKINDSKKMSKKHRREMLAFSSTFSKSARGCSTVNEIENLGINASNDLAALRAIVLMVRNFSFNTDKNLFFDIFLG